MQPWDIFRLSISVQENWLGYSIPYRSLENWVMIPGQRTLTKTSKSVAGTIGQAWPWIGREELSLYPQALPPRIFMEEIVRAPIFLPIACWRWMLPQVNEYGIINWFIMIFWIGICLPRPIWSP